MKDFSLLSMDIIKPELARTARGLFDKLVNSFGSQDPLATSSSVNSITRYGGMLAAASGGHGSYSGGGGSDSCFTIDICPDLLIAAIAAAAAGAFYLIYTGITKASRRRRKRSFMPNDDDLDDDSISFATDLSHFTDVLFGGNLNFFILILMLKNHWKIGCW